MTTHAAADRSWHHHMKNQLTIIDGLSKLLLSELDAHDPCRQEADAIRAAAVKALELLDSHRSNPTHPHHGRD